MGDRDALDKLEKRLNFDPEENVPKRSSLFARGESAPSEWAVKTAEKTVRKVSGMKPVELLFIGAVIFFIIALVTAGLLFFAGNNTVSTKNVDISITGPSEIGAGSTLSLQVVVANRNAVPMELTDLVLEFPSGTRSAADISEDLPRVRESLGTIEPGKSVNRTIRAVPFGVQGTAINVKATVEYRVPSSNAVYVVNANYGTRINESPASISIDALTEAVSGQKVTFTVNVRSNAPEVLKDMMLVATYPPGFSFDSSVPEPAGESAWALGGATVSYSLEIPDDAWRIIDRGTNYAEIDADLNLFVVRNDYLSLSRMLRLLRQEDPIQRAFPPNTEFVLVSEPSRSLDEKDCRNVLERNFLFHFPADNYYAIARSGDAGLLTLRSPSIGSRFAAAVLERLSVGNSQ
jgi:hypothetical protein